MEYTGPVPATPTTSSSDAVWHQWWTYQTLLQNIRYENERAADKVALVARQAVLDQQHAEKMAAEAACAAATQALAAAQQAGAAAIGHPQPGVPPSRAELVFSILRDHPQATILTNGQLVDGCKAIVDAFVAKFPGAVRA